MKTVPLYFVSIQGIAQAQSLSFTSGSVSDAPAGTLTFQGPTNRVIYFERLKYDTQTWQIVATNTLNFAGPGTHATSLGGNSQFPVPMSSCYANRLTPSQVANTTPGYQSATLLSNGANWWRRGNVVTPRPNLSEGFWFCVPNNRTWTKPARPICP